MLVLHKDDELYNKYTRDACMKFVFSKNVCKNLRKALRKEWIETNGLGSYASSSIACCNTRKYHGLLVVKLDDPPGRYVLLSTLEETLLIGGREADLSCRKHPDVYYPSGHEFLNEVTLGHIPTFVYRYGDIRLTRQVMMLEKQNVTLIRYYYDCGGEQCNDVPKTAKLRVKPLLAYRNMHALTVDNIDLQVKTWPAQNGFSIRPYNTMPPLFMQCNTPFVFRPSPDWYKDVEYMIEATRGFANHEDLFQPGVMDLDLELGKPIVLCAATDDVLEKLGPLDKLWAEQEQKRIATAKNMEHLPVLERHLQREGQRFIMTENADDQAVIAGFHWFEAWGRDTCIALPGLTFGSNESEQGFNVLNRLAKGSVNGQIPNMFSSDGNHAYNCIDASLWFGWAAQSAFDSSPEAPKHFRKHCWPFIKKVIEVYSSSQAPHVYCDEEGFLHVGSPDTQLTWMDANVNGKAVTPRHGCPVEINALWYNLLYFANQASKVYKENLPHKLCQLKSLERMRTVFKERFWVNQKYNSGYLADCWRPDEVDSSLRPNQLFAVGLPYPILEEDNWGDVVETCRNSLLTAVGMRTLAPSDPRYQTLYKGSPEQRDGAYHQGTAWPWPLGIYTDALLRAAWDKESAAKELLETITPLLTTHLVEAGVGTISEIFMADPPHLPDGCIAQAWSISEVIRLLATLRKVAPKVVQTWEEIHVQPIVNINF